MGAINVILAQYKYDSKWVFKKVVSVTHVEPKRSSLLGKKYTGHKNTECPVQGIISISSFPENMSPNRRLPQLNYLWVKVADKRAVTNLKYYFEVFFILERFLIEIFLL